MRLKTVLTATAAAVVLTMAGLAQAQQAPKSQSSPPPSSPPQSSPATPGAQTQSAKPGGGASLSAGTLHEIKDEKAMASGLNVSAKDLDGMDIIGSDGKKIGDVNKVLADSSNSVKAVTVDVGGFLGMGSREVVMPIDKLQKGQDKDKLRTSMTKAEIEKLDEWKDQNRSSTPQRSSSPGATSPSTAPSTAPRTGSSPSK